MAVAMQVLSSLLMYQMLVKGYAALQAGLLFIPKTFSYMHAGTSHNMQVRKLQVVNAGVSADLAYLRAVPSSPHHDSQQQQPCVALPLELPNQRVQPAALPLLLQAQAAQTRYSTHCLSLPHQKYRGNQRCLTTGLVSQLLGYFPEQLLRHLLGLTYHHSCTLLSVL